MITNWIEPHVGLESSLKGTTECPSPAFTILATNYFVARQEDLQFNASDWLAARLELFVKYTMRSVNRGVTTPDAWLLLISPWVEPLVRDLSAVISRWPYIEILTVEPEEGRNGAMARWIRENRSRIGARKLISARVDNDDALSRDFLHLCNLAIAANSVPLEGNLAISFPYGLQHVESENVTYVDMQTNNHFIATASSSIENFFGPFDHHGRLYAEHRLERAAVREVVTRRPMWLEVVHGDNALNRARVAEKVIMSNSDWRYRFGLQNIGS